MFTTKDIVFTAKTIVLTPVKLQGQFTTTMFFKSQKDNLFSFKNVSIAGKNKLDSFHFTSKILSFNISLSSLNKAK
ncbi:MAG: hypothetical protein LBC61_02825 [Candidatus Peribacteria bacterium]|nr:hypothetical protein [Candidatus Peribacteria bacterium]